MSTYQLVDEQDKSVLFWLLRNREQLPPLCFDCRASDLLIEYNRELHKALQEHGLDHVYEEFSGGHSWGYWKDHLQDSLRLFGRVATT